MSEYDFDRLRDDFIKLKIDEKWDELSEWVESNEIYCTYYNDNPKMYIIDSKFCGYSNNCFITSKKFFNEIILKYSNGDPHIEPNMDKIWGDLGLRIGISEGFLTHVRMDGHNNCWCCHTDSGGTNNTPKCSCCVSEYIKDIGFTTDNDGKDISQFQTGNEWLKYV
jgi:hypothetical protein